MFEPSIFAVSVALAMVAVMGFAIQRGGVCLVAALGELVERRQPRQLLAIGEAALWAAGAMALSILLGHAPPPVAASSWNQAVLGGALLGLGALTNRACAFGTIAHLGSGDVAYLAMPIGFFFGCLVLPSIWDVDAPRAMPAVAWAAPLLAAAWVVMLTCGARKLALANPGERLADWPQRHTATVIGLAFVTATLVAGPWAYTDVLADLARREAVGSDLRLVLFGALLVGAVAGGISAGSWRLRAPAREQVFRCFGGGFLMGAGSLLVPGGNDGLILIGLPSLNPSALFALGSMGATVLLWIALARGRRIVRRPAFG